VILTSSTTPAASAKPELGGIICASLTPVTPDGSIDIDRMAAHIRGLFDDGCRFVSPFGSTGEGPSFSVREKTAALTALGVAGIDPGRLIPASMSAALDDVVEMVRFGAAGGYPAVLIVPPFYYGGASQDGIADVFAALADRFGGTLPIDIILYHIPQLTRVGFGVELVTKLMARHGRRIVGIKDSTGDRDHTLMLQQTFPQLRIFTGDDRVLGPLLAAGGAGMIGGLPNVVARDLCEIYRDPTGAGTAVLRERAAIRIQAVDDLGGIAALKAIKARVLGDPAWMATRPPLQALDAATSAELLGRFERSEFPFPSEPA
jgi:4-hydroxy-tetrahydrodipicolinate synthase